MTVHISRPAVGVSDLDHLKEVMAVRAQERQGGIYITTRNVPKRVEELLDGGSIYWIIGGQFRARQRALRVERLEDDNGRGYCNIYLDSEVVVTQPYPRRAHQGWRYLDPADAPPDLKEGDADDLPPDMAAELKDLGLL
ncbi:MAG: DUF1489 family protein [Alphaproteobacteria bacterium]